jgi:hypothetical protein
MLGETVIIKKSTCLKDNQAYRVILCSSWLFDDFMYELTFWQIDISPFIKISNDK